MPDTNTPEPPAPEPVEESAAITLSDFMAIADDQKEAEDRMLAGDPILEPEPVADPAPVPEPVSQPVEPAQAAPGPEVAAPDLTQAEDGSFSVTVDGQTHSGLNEETAKHFQFLSTRRSQTDQDNAGLQTQLQQMQGQMTALTSQINAPAAQAAPAEAPAPTPDFDEQGFWNSAAELDGEMSQDGKFVKFLQAQDARNKAQGYMTADQVQDQVFNPLAQHINNQATQIQAFTPAARDVTDRQVVDQYVQNNGQGLVDAGKIFEVVRAQQQNLVQTGAMSTEKAFSNDYRDGLILNAANAALVARIQGGSAAPVAPAPVAAPLPPGSSGAPMNSALAQAAAANRNKGIIPSTGEKIMWDIFNKKTIG